MFKKNILILNSREDINPLFDLFAELNNKGYVFYIFTANQKFLKKCREHNWFGKKIWPLLFLDRRLGFLMFIIFYPFWFLAALIFLAYFKFNKKIKSIICLDWPEKIIIALPAKILGLKNILLECPCAKRVPHKIGLWFYKLSARRTRIIALTDFTKIQLEKSGFNPEKITVIRLGIKPSRLLRQKNIFAEIARADTSRLRRKFFTIGTAAMLDKKQNIEILFRAAKKCLTVAPNLQIIIIGDGPERKNLGWLAKKMEIDNLIWFVGKQNYLKKWLDNFDIFIFAGKALTLSDIYNVLRAMAVGLPIIASGDMGLEDFVDNSQNGIIIENNHSEELTQAIIKLQQNKPLRERLGQNGKEMIDKYFLFDKMVEKFEDVLNFEN